MSRRNERDSDDDINDVNSDDDGQEEERTRRSSGKGVRKRIFDDTSNENKEVDNEDNEDYDESEREQEPTSRWKNEMRKMEKEITELKRKNKSLEISLLGMRHSSTPSRSKTGWTGEEINFVKDINDFCKDRLYPKEKFLRKNWQEYLPNDRRSLCSLCMKQLSIPEGSDPMDIWDRVIVPAIRDKYQSMKCNLQNKIKSIYMSMRILFEYATQNLLMQHSHNKIIATVYISTGDIRLVEPDPLSEGFSRYAACNMEHYVFEFLLNYVR